MLTLQDISGALSEEGFTVPLDDPDPPADGGGLALAPPQTSVIERLSEATLLALKRRRIVIRHATDDRIVALLEIVSPGNKDGRGPLQALVDKAVAAIQQGYHLLVIDLFPPTAADPRGLHDRIWREMEGDRFEPLADKPLTLAAYRIARDVTAYVEPISVGQKLPDTPLYYQPDRYVKIPLEKTYLAAYEGVPRRWKRVIEEDKG